MSETVPLDLIRHYDPSLGTVSPGETGRARFDPVQRKMWCGKMGSVAVGRPTEVACAACLKKIVAEFDREQRGGTAR